MPGGSVTACGRACMVCPSTAVTLVTRLEAFSVQIVDQSLSGELVPGWACGINEEEAHDAVRAITERRAILVVVVDRLINVSVRNN